MNGQNYTFATDCNACLLKLSIRILQNGPSTQRKVTNLEVESRFARRPK